MTETCNYGFICGYQTASLKLPGLSILLMLHSSLCDFLQDLQQFCTRLQGEYISSRNRQLNKLVSKEAELADRQVITEIISVTCVPANGNRSEGNILVHCTAT